MSRKLNRFPILYEGYKLGETRDVTVLLSVANFKYEALETVGDESPIGGPAVARSRFKVGETVYCHYKVRNDGTVPDKATIVVTDIDTGATVATYMTASVDPGWRYEAFKATIGAMPNKDWKLRFALTP